MFYPISKRNTDLTDATDEHGLDEQIIKIKAHQFPKLPKPHNSPNPERQTKPIDDTIDHTDTDGRNPLQ